MAFFKIEEYSPEDKNKLRSRIINLDQIVCYTSGDRSTEIGVLITTFHGREEPLKIIWQGNSWGRFEDRIDKSLFINVYYLRPYKLINYETGL